jgi:methionine-rich copper-binding protein CopC/putative copper export protein
VIRRAALAAAAVLVALCGVPAAAAAHPLLLTAAPAPGVIDPSAPTSMTLEFSEAAVPSGSAVSITGPNHFRLKDPKLLSEDGGRQLAFTMPTGMKPGVYHVTWLALGIDGHNVSGTFAFGVAEKNGQLPPGAAGLGGAGTGALGGSAAGQSPFTVAATWLGVLAAALALGGLVLVFALRRAGVLAEEQGRLGGLGRLLGAAWVVAVLAALESVIANASAGANSSFSLSLLTASGTGVSSLVRLAVAVLVGLALLAAWRLRLGDRVQARLFAAGGFAVLATYGLSGHVLADGSALAGVGMVVHVATAGLWAGGVLTLFILAATRRVELGAAARAFAPFAIVALAIAGVTGVIAAVREVDHWYFLRYSTYGNVVIIKIAIVLIAAAIGGITTLRARRAGGAERPSAKRAVRPRSGLIAFEAGLVFLVIGVASVLSGLAQGRGEPLPAQKGDLLPGPAFASALLPQGSAAVTLTPARVGLDTLIVAAPAGAQRVEVRMACGCDVRPVISLLHRAPDATSYTATVPVPSAGDWYAYLYVNGHQATSPVSLPAGVPTAAGAPVQNVLAIADLSGPGAGRCREFVEGLDLAIGRLNSDGGVDGGDKLALDVLDDGGSPAAAESLAGRALAAHPVAFMPCGAGSEPGIVAASRAGVPSIVGDPATGLVDAPHVYRVTADPYADGYAIGQAIRKTFISEMPLTAKTVRIVGGLDAQGARRLAGLRAALRGSDVRVQVLKPSVVIDSTSASFAALLNRQTTLAMVLDGTDAQEPAFAAALARLPAKSAEFDPATVLVSDRLLSENLIDASGEAGQIGIVQGTSEVAIDSDDALALAQALPSMFPGVDASIESLRGFVSGLALTYGLQQGTSSSSVEVRLLRPAPFTDALDVPWLSTAPAAGSQRLGILVPNFLSTTLLPTSDGGEQYTGQYFANGAWERTTSDYYGPALTAPVPQIPPGDGLSGGADGSSSGTYSASAGTSRAAG